MKKEKLKDRTAVIGGFGIIIYLLSRFIRGMAWPGGLILLLIGSIMIIIGIILAFMIFFSPKD